MEIKPFYTFRDWSIPDYMRGGIERYINDHIRPGSFLTAIISNDLKEAIFCADDFNLNNLPAYVAYFYNETDSRCWGSKEKMEAWIEKM